jgi:beta-glucanase (GH16 family)
MVAEEDGKPVRPKFSSKIHVPVTLAPATTSLPPAGYQMVFADDFNGSTLDADKWVYRTDSKLLSTQVPKNVSVADGNLRIGIRKQSANGMNYTGGGIISKADFVYGYFEARFKTPAAEGWHTSFWAQKHDGSGGTTPTNAVLELDFCEQDGGDPHLYSFGAINQRPDATKKETWNAGRWVVPEAPDTAAAFHVWSCEFTPETVRFYFDGRLAKEASSATFPHGEMNVWLTSIAGKLKGDRQVDDASLPNAAVYDYVRVYQNPAYREAEAAARVAAAERLRQIPPRKTKVAAPVKELN